jgi:hypothetical protein
MVDIRASPGSLPVILESMLKDVSCDTLAKVLVAYVLASNSMKVS